MDNDIKNRAAKIKLLVLDVDGVLTDGKIYLSGDNQEFKSFNVRDGSALVRGRKEGLNIALISGRSSSSVDRRARELGITEVYQGISDKLPVLEELMDRYSCGREETAYIGDDIADLPIFRRVGLSIAVLDAHPLVIEAADHRTIRRGGEGAVMEIVELLLSE
ncbi:MAG: HAD-IIIA family hydrolase [Candidatus Auribacterota bacterium]|nr:HAD-IIIA family hydrolase [Candidatus Auribacterota bacterium]